MITEMPQFLHTKGPGAYALPSDVDSIQGPLIGEKLYRDIDPEYPAPDTYDIPETVGTGLKKSFGIMYDTANSKLGSGYFSCGDCMCISENKNPPPNRYYIKNPKKNAPSMTYRAFPWPCKCQDHNICSRPCHNVCIVVETRPGPTDHDPVTQTVRPRVAEYSCRKTCLPVFPDILNYSAEYGDDVVAHNCTAIIPLQRQYQCLLQGSTVMTETSRKILTLPIPLVHRSQ